jgi:hypothetical protein
MKPAISYSINTLIWTGCMFLDAPQLLPHFRFNAALLWIEKNGSVIHFEKQMWN